MRLFFFAPKKSSSLVPRRVTPPAESWDAPKNEFYVDTNGDDNNLVYGSIHRYAIPDYRRSGSGSIIGLPRNMKIDKDKGDGKGLVVDSSRTNKENSSIKAMRQAFAKLAHADSKQLRLRKDETGLDEAIIRGLDFVPLSVATKKRRTRSDSEHSDESDGDYDNHYRSIMGLKKNTDAPNDKDLEYVSDSKSEGDYVSTEAWGDRKKMV